MDSVTVSAFTPPDLDAIHSIIRSVWREFDDPGEPTAELDLANPLNYYASPASSFWVARAGTIPIGTIALQALPGHAAALKRLYVLPAFRGPALSAASHLLGAALAHARRCGTTALYLGTMDVFTRSHSFYRRSGFEPIARDLLPPAFPLDPADTLFFRRLL